VCTCSLLDLLLDADLVGPSALLLAAVDSAGVEASKALAAHLLFAVVLAGEDQKRGLNDTTAKPGEREKENHTGCQRVLDEQDRKGNIEHRYETNCEKASSSALSREGIGTLHERETRGGDQDLR